MRVRVKRKKGRSLLIIVICAVFLASIYLSMLLSTNPLVKCVEQIWSGEVSPSSIEDWDDTVLANFDVTAERPTTQKVDIKINRIFVLHTFSKGYMWVYSSCEAVNKDGKVTYGFSGCERWQIAKTESGWQITKIIRKA